MGYRCPLCDRELRRDLILFLDHTNQHVIDRIKLAHPEWVTEDGACKPCVAYYESELAGAATNLGPLEVRKRVIQGTLALSLGVLAAIYLKLSEMPRGLRLGLFVPFFLGMFALIQAREKTCSILAERESKNMDSGTMPVENDALAKGLKEKGRRILLKSVLLAALTTAVFIFI